MDERILFDGTSSYRNMQNSKQKLRQFKSTFSDDEEIKQFYSCFVRYMRHIKPGEVYEIHIELIKLF